MRAHGYKNVDQTQHPHLGAATELTLRHFAHELNSLLDGSLRCVNLAERTVKANAAHAGDSPGVIEQLERARIAMQRMTVLLNRALSNEQIDPTIFNESVTVREVVEQCLAHLAAMAQERQVQFDVDVQAEIAKERASLIGAVLLNGLRNAVEACGRVPGVPHRVELSVSEIRQRELQIIIADTGPGVGAIPTPGGHGVGLDLCDRIVRSMGGELQLMNIPFGGGAVLQVRIPLSAMHASGGQRG